jgi:hypothetical protein
MDEIWKTLDKYPGYEVSSLGRVKGPKGIRRLQIDPKGYLYVGIGKERPRVHRLVCIAFHGEPPTKDSMALHGPDFNKANCQAANLRWGTSRDNAADLTKAGNRFYIPGRDQRAHRNGHSKLDWDKVRKIRALRIKGYTQQGIADMFGITQVQVGNIVRNESWAEEF